MKLNLFLIAMIVLVSCSVQKSGTGQSDITMALENRNYTFTAQTVFPTEDSRFNPRLMFPGSANLYQLSGGYDVRVTADSVIAYLPFYGRSFTAPMNPSEGGIKFTSTDFSYKSTIRKKNFEIDIRPNDNRDVRSLYFVISPNGYATLQVLSNNKTPISFNGVIEAN
ncbi:MAG: DUF4251 domain-containing protein [Niabella sp.]